MTPRRERVRQREIPEAGSIHWKPLRDSHYVIASLQPGQAGLRQLFVAQRVILRLRALARAVPAEQLLGLLIGQRWDCPQSGVRWLLVESLLEGASAVPDPKALSACLGALLARRVDGAECVGWYGGTSAADAHLSRTLATVHANTFEHAWQTALILTNDARAGAFFLHDLRDARWFQAPFFEVTDAPRNTRQRSVLATAIAWPEYITTSAVTPLVVPEASAPPPRPHAVVVPERARPIRVEVLAEPRRAEPTADRTRATLTLVRDTSRRIANLGVGAGSGMRDAASRLGQAAHAAAGAIASGAAAARHAAVSLGSRVAAQAASAAQERKARAAAARQARAAREAEERRRQEEHARRRAERAREEAERRRQEAERAAERAREEAERAAERARMEAEQRARDAAERAAREEADRAARVEAERVARAEAERAARLEAEQTARLEAEARERKKAETRARLEAAERARVEAERALLERAERVMRQAAERANQEAEQQAQRERELQARRETERSAIVAAPAADRLVPRVVARERPPVPAPQDLDDTTAADGPYRYLALARREGFQVSAKLERGTPERPETVWLLNEPESGLRLTIVTTDEEVREASLHYNIRTDDDALIRITPPEHRDVESRIIYVREPCIAELRSRCRRLRATGALAREWKVTPALHPGAAPAQYR